MKKLITMAVKYRALTVFAIILITIMGVGAYITMSQNEDPKITVRAMQIITYWPGATAEDIELYVSKPIEDAISKQDDIDKMRSESMANVSVISIDISKYITEDQVKTAIQQIRNYVNDARGNLPDGIVGPEINDRFGETTAYVIGIVSDNRSNRELESIAERIKDMVKTVPGVGDTNIIGAQPEKVYIYINREFLQPLGINPAQIISAVRDQNVQIAQPYLRLSGRKILIEVTGSYRNVNQIRDTVVYADPSGKILRLKDLAEKIEYGYVSPRVMSVRTDGEKSVILAVSMKRGFHIVRWGKQVDALLKEIKEDMPRDVNLEILSDQPDGVAKAVKGFMSNFWQAIALVLIIIGLGMGLRNAMVIAIAIPFIVMATFAVMKQLNIELQQMSINALIIALGMLVDNEIVIVDNINRFIMMGYKKEDAAVLGSNELTVPLFSATATTLAAFLPLALMPGDVGEYIGSIPKVVSACLMISYLVAMLVVPAIATMILPDTEQQLKAKAEKDRRKKEREKNTGGRLTFKTVYYSIIDRTMGRKSVSVVIMIAVFIISIFLGSRIPSQFFPESDKTQFTMDVWLPEGYDYNTTSGKVSQIESELLKMKKDNLVKNFVTYVGFGGPRFFLAIEPIPPQENYAQIVVDTNSAKDTGQAVARLQSFVKKIPGARIDVKKLMTGPPVKAPIEVKIAGMDINKLKAYAGEIESVFRSIGGVTTISNDFGVDTEKIVLDIDQEKANLLGITTDDIATTFLVGFEGYPISRLKAPERQIDITLTLPDRFKKSIEDMKSMYVTSSKTGKKHRLDELARLDYRSQNSKIQRFNQIRTITVSVNLSGRLASEALDDAMPGIRKVKLDKGYRMWFAGEQEASGEAFGDLGGLAVMALMLLYLILAIQFKSLRIAGAIYLTLPMAIVGAVIGMTVMKQALGFMSALGLISLAGIVVNNAIVMIEFVQDKLREGHDVMDAIKESGVVRFRPIMLTTITTLGGLMPLALFGGVLFPPMCWVIIFGLTMSTVLTLVILPLLFVLTGGAKDAVRMVENEKEGEREIKPVYQQNE